jgi:threonine dehydrogenase-like Zn-dependent dehydrogenase
MRKKIIFPSKRTAELIEDPTPLPDPASHEVTVQTLGCGICQVEIKQFLGQLDTRYPLTHLGHESVGIVTEAGASVESLREGDFVTTLWAPGFHEYFNVRESWAIALPKPESGQEHLWISEPVSCALNGIISTDVQPGEHILLLGAGYMGLLLVQLLNHTPHAGLVASDRFADRLALADRLGATETILAAESALESYVSDHGKFHKVIEATGAPNMVQYAANYITKGGALIIFADKRHHRDETIDWFPFIDEGISILPANPGSSTDFPAVWRKSVDMMKAGRLDQSQLISHVWDAEDCQSAMEYASGGNRDYIKGFFRWNH